MTKIVFHTCDNPPTRLCTAPGTNVLTTKSEWVAENIRSRHSFDRLALQFYQRDLFSTLLSMCRPPWHFLWWLFVFGLFLSLNTLLTLHILDSSSRTSGHGLWLPSMGRQSFPVCPLAFLLLTVTLIPVAAACHKWEALHLKWKIITLRPFLTHSYI